MFASLERLAVGREAFCDRFVKGHEELPGRLAHAFAQELPKPCLNLFLLGVMGADVRGEIWDLFFRVTKGIKSRVVFDAKVGGISREWSRQMVVSNSSTWQEELKIDKSYAVSEDRRVSYPDIDWLGRSYFKLAVQQTLVKAVTRPKHQLVRAKSHRLPIPVCCRVVYGENSHQLPDFPRSLYAQTLWHARPRAAGANTPRRPLFSACYDCLHCLGTLPRVFGFFGN